MTKIRPFINTDLPSILDIYANSKLDELVNETTQFELLPLENDKKRFAALLESDLYVFDNGDVIGYCALFESEIRALFVHPKAREKGVGKIMLKFLLSKITGTATLYVAKNNIIAKNLYAALNFSVVDEFETTYNGKPVLANKMALNRVTDNAG